MAQIDGADRAGEMAVLVQVVEQGSLTAAAQRLRLSPSAVSKLITRLENRLGVRLLQRTTRRVSATAEGRLFYERAREILDEIDAAEELARAGRLRPRGTLRVSLSHGFGMSQIVPLAPEFTARHPESSCSSPSPTGASTSPGRASISPSGWDRSTTNR
jgi:DNA-binding transcriptional LysR family regulator